MKEERQGKGREAGREEMIQILSTHERMQVSKTLSQNKTCFRKGWG